MMANKSEGVKLRAVVDENSEVQSQTSKIDEEDADYDPHLYRKVTKATNNFETLVHFLKCSLGTGILAMPQAFARAGLITGIISTIIIGIIITHCLHILIRSQYVMCKRRKLPLLTYPESMVVALESGPSYLGRCARTSAIVVDVFLVVYQLGICCVYVVFIGATIKKIVDPYYHMSIEVYMLISLGPLIAINCIRNLKLLAPWSALANVLTFVGLGIVVYILLSRKRSTDPYDLWGSISTYPLYFGTTLFSLTAVGVVVALENNMASPKDFGKPCGVLNVGMTIIVVMYVGFGVLGYINCIAHCSDSILLDFKHGPLEVTVFVMFIGAIFISYGLQCYVPVQVVWFSYVLPRLESKGSQHLLAWEYAVRIGLCLITFVLAVSIPQLGLFISLFGALCLSALGMIFPAIMEMCITFGDKSNAARLKTYKDFILMILGVIGLLAGTYATLYEIVKTFGVHK